MCSVGLVCVCVQCGVCMYSVGVRVCVVCVCQSVCSVRCVCVNVCRVGCLYVCCVCVCVQCEVCVYSVGYVCACMHTHREKKMSRVRVTGGDESQDEGAGSQSWKSSSLTC